ncbi:MAG: class I mannose-6-phosphate isomerase [Cellulosilyticum sp.]|nr:class I mannose-6-phosphate isomerase [Cellulosilyticum sp.]
MFKIQPVYKDYIWGGNKLKEAYGKESDLDIVAESWELSTHPSGICEIEIDGEKKSLAEYIKENGKKVLGTKSMTEDELPILIKLIDARDNLSVQVHPDDDYAKVYENDLGKTEMWYVLEAEEGAQLVYGFKKDLSKETFKAAIEENTLSELLNYVEVHKGDVFFIKPGTMHAIGKGIVIAEIQESSNVTYRVYDYGRVGTDGKPRELHIDKALEVTQFNKAEELSTPYVMKMLEGVSIGTLASCPYFTVKRIQLEKEMHVLASEESFHDLLIVEGTVEIVEGSKKWIGKKGDSFFVPAGSGNYTISGQGELILSTL